MTFPPPSRTSWPDLPHPVTPAWAWSGVARQITWPLLSEPSIMLNTLSPPFIVHTLSLSLSLFVVVVGGDGGWVSCSVTCLFLRRIDGRFWRWRSSVENYLYVDVYVSHVSLFAVLFFVFIMLYFLFFPSFILLTAFIIIIIIIFINVIVNVLFLIILLPQHRV